MTNELIQQLYSPHTEEALVGAALIDPQILERLDIEPSHFYLSKCAIIWQAMREMWDHGTCPDAITLGNELYNRGKLEEIGGSSYLASLINVTASSLGADDYAKIIKDKSARRRTVRLAEELARSANDLDGSLDEDIGRIMTDLTMVANVNRGAVQWAQYLRQANEIVQERSANPEAIWGMPTGYKDFDLATGGLQPAEVMILSGEPGVGKSIFTMQLAEQLAQAGYPGAFYSLEMLGEAIGIRALSANANVRTRLLKTGRATGEDYTAYYAAYERLEKLPIYMSDENGWNTTSLRADLARLRKTANIKWFVVDYTYLLTDGVGKLNEIERTQLIGANLKAICKSLRLAGVVNHSMNKAGMGQDKTHSTALRGSGQVAYDADLILFLTNPDEMKPNIIRATFGKGRELENPRTHFDLERMDGIPKFREVQAETYDLKKGGKR